MELVNIKNSISMKKIKNPDNKTGIWLDQKKAILIRLVGDNEPVAEKLKSGVESRVRFTGEVTTMTRFGRATINDQEKKQHRQKNEKEKYFKKIIALLTGADYLYIFGPSDTRHELINDIAKDPVLRKKFIATEKAGRMSEKMIIKQTMDYFNGEIFRSEKKKLRKLLANH
jgi:hypothetical protein